MKVLVVAAVRGPAAICLAGVRRPARGAADQKGFGLTVLQTAASDLGAIANCDFRAEGFVYTLQGPFET